MNEELSIFDIEPGTVECPIIDPEGEETGITFVLLPQSSREVQVVTRRYKKQLTDAFRKNKDATKIIEDQSVDMKVAATKSVRFADKVQFCGNTISKFDDDEKTLRKLFKEPRFKWLSDQVEEAMTDDAASFRGS